jgi:hypothetical protein
MRIESKVVLQNNEIGAAIFQAIEKEGRILLALDLGQPPESQPVFFHPNQAALIKISERELDYRHVGNPIDLSEYLNLPHNRRGFFRVK